MVHSNENYLGIHQNIQNFRLPIEFERIDLHEDRLESLRIFFTVKVLYYSLQENYNCWKTLSLNIRKTILLKFYMLFCKIH